MVGHAHATALFGIDAIPVEVEAQHAEHHVDAFAIVGLPDKAVQEAKERVRSALRAAGMRVPFGRVVVNLAPGAVRKEGPGFDLAIALAVAAADQRVLADALDRCCCVGELALDGRIRPVRGVLSIAEAARRRGLTRVVCAPEVAAEAALVEGIDAVPCATLREAADVMNGVVEAAPAPQLTPVAASPEPDLADVRGQPLARRALEIAAAGGHNLLLVGPPGVGKTMLARRLPAILPPLAPDETLAASRIHSIAGHLPAGSGLLTQRPFRAPHHSASAAALLGGGPALRPGEIALAHHGVLFLDELPEFRRDVLEALRGPLEEGVIRLGRAAGTVVFPARTTLVAAMNPCPCGAADVDACGCPAARVAAYRRKVSGPLLDRIDLVIRLVRPRPADLRGEEPERTAAVAARVAAARTRQVDRGSLNAALDGDRLRRHAAVDARAAALLDRAAERLSLSPRGVVRSLRVARSIADLAGDEAITSDHLAEALSFRVGAAL